MTDDTAATADNIPGRFVFVPLKVLSGDAFVAIIPASLRSKQKLFRVLADQFRLPPYFGRNWDALEECLRDLSWLPQKNVYIHHRDLPLPPGSHDRQIYIKILRNAANHWQNSGSRSLTCQFPAETKEEVLSLLGK